MTYQHHCFKVVFLIGSITILFKISLYLGFHSFDNSSLNSPWKKTLAGEEHFKKIVYVSGLLTHEELVGGLVDLLNDKTQ